VISLRSWVFRERQDEQDARFLRRWRQRHESDSRRDGSFSEISRIVSSSTAYFWCES
jgi:hypothetical protein